MRKIKEIRIIKGSMENLNGIMRIEASSFTEHWSKTMFDAEFKNPFSYCYIAVNEGNVVGYLIFWVLFDELHILNIAVDEEYRNRSIGTKLMRMAIKMASRRQVKRANLEVRCSNDAAINLYKKMGFQEEFRRKEYYDNPKEHACVMIYKFKPRGKTSVFSIQDI